MDWQKYNLVFQLLAPMHIGWRKVSNLQQTRGYVPGKVFWAALTARLTREAKKGADGAVYERFGNLVQDHFRFTYLYPATQDGTDYQTHYPWEDDFDYLFLDSYTSAALNYANQSAEDGLLHETEFISPHTRTNLPVYLKGDLYVKSTLPTELQNWGQLLDKLQFGGERGYGWGRVKQVNKLNPVSNKPIYQLTNDHKITAHLKAENVSNISGSIEPLVGWERNNEKDDNGKDNKPWQLSSPTICYPPGSVVTAAQTFTIIEDGLWQPYNS